MCSLVKGARDRKKLNIELDFQSLFGLHVRAQLCPKLWLSEKEKNFIISGSVCVYVPADGSWVEQV
jgi:hypothetical protein